MAQRHKPCLANASARRARFAIILQTPRGKASVAAITTAWMLSSTIAFAADFETGEAAIPSVGQFDNQRFGGIRGKLHDWKVTVGVGSVYLPEYEGSDEFEIQPFPIISAQFGEYVHLDADGLRVDVWQHGGLKFAVTGGVEMGRKEDDSDYLRGLGDIDVGGVVGGLVSYETGPIELYASLDKTIGGSDGLTGKVGAKASYQYEKFIFSADLSGTWADSKHMESYFGITSAQSTRSGLAEYEAGAGFKRVDLKGSVTYRWTEHWSITGAAGAGLLLGDAKDSPIVKDDVQPFAMLGVGYRF
ncbi:outer membrane scaffolding protein for murein synthesis (MipA/OmpV family) [Ochrobactrum daejeonense]|uniref:Outer membrane scaffolding protein for murein synthesis (MipA/OmpV family) n=1 Tax=Brucella daejeonensis TaxID=659015 RepID=A0A7W9AUZ2_9HYPH|nr:MipA/OmpV family protein [Brucella daejeonensis]MBB5701088.1 outer membrane scaffolding protein for murein synthesis (MipA/OmpV family) [Brucella daejeonensis]